jgi:hypothetical protein
MMDCKHNWQQVDKYMVCTICQDTWNAERLVNALQAKVERLEEKAKNND